MLTQLHHLVERSAAVHPTRSALTHAEATVDYEALWLEVRRVGAGLSGAGLRRGERVAIYLDKRIEAVTAAFGASVAGAVFVPVNPGLKPKQVSHILADSAARVLITTSARWTQVAAALGDASDLTDVLLVDAGPANVDSGVTVRRWSDFSVREAGPGGLPRGVDSDIAAILYTSGSTGSPKGVVLTHRNLIVGAESVSTYLGNTPDDVILSVLPLSFDAGFSQVTTAFCVGAHVVLSNYLLPGDVVKLCARHRVTGLTCVPPLWIQLTEVAWPDDARRHLRYFANTGGRMPKTTLDRLRGLFPTAAPFLMYGLTEAFRSTFLDPSQVDARPDSIGKAIPNAEILVVGPDGALCAPGEEGELVHRGPLVALGYWRDPERTAQRFRPVPGADDGWRAPEIAVWSGDTVVADDEGYLYFVGRSDEMIKTSGYRVSPSEVEEVAYSTGLVRDAVAIGVPDERLGQRVVLFVSAVDENPDLAALSQALSRSLPRFMVPSEVLVRPELPRSANGKFDRVLLREQFNA